MKSCVKLLVSAIALSALLTGLAFAYQFNFGALLTDTSIEEKIAFGSEGRFSLRRNSIQIPRDYGRLITIIPSGAGTVFWFESEDGTFRNVVVNAATPVVIERKGSVN